MNNIKQSKLLVFLATAVLLFGCTETEVLLPADGATDTTGTTGTGTTTTPTSTALKIGNGSGGSFTDGELEIKNTTVTANGSIDVSAFIVDANNNLSTATNAVTFNSNCAIQGLASFTSTNVSTTTGIATTTYIDGGCQVSDTIFATADWDTNLAAYGDITIDSSVPATANTLRIGTGTGVTFTEGAIAVTTPAIASDGSTLISVNLVDANGDLLTSANTVTFTSDCEQLGAANFNSSVVTTSTGTAGTTYNAAGCVGPDVISATVTVGSTNKVATGSVTVAAAAAGSVQYTSASATTIALKGTGTTTVPENSTITFTILDGNSQPVSGEAVTFVLNSTIGGITLSEYTATSNASGVVTTTLQSGSVATSVRVSAMVNSNTLLVTNSNSIVIATGPPDQDSMSLSAETLNPRAWNLEGQTVRITARLADRYNNQIQDGTTVLFTTELGSIKDSCQTVNGGCSVDWISQNPRGDAANAGRSTILATVVGEESFFDENGNGVFDGVDTFTDLGEAYVDINENGVRDPTEPPSPDFNGNEVWDGPSGKYNGAGCAHATLCDASPTISVRDSLVLVMAEDNPAIIAMGTNGSSNNLCNDLASCIAYRFSGASLNTDTIGSLSVTLGGTVNAQTLPSGTDVEFTVDNGKITSGSKHSIGNTTRPNSVYVSIAADTTPSNDGALSMKVSIGDGGPVEEFFIAAIDDSGTSTIPSSIRLGTGVDAGFVNGDLNVTTSSLAYGGSTTVSVNVVDDAGALLTDAYTINFSSTCVESGIASFDTASVITTTGTASATYTSITCSGTDTIYATITGDTASASKVVTIAPAIAGSIQSSSPSSSLIALKGTGSTSGTPENSTITFSVKNIQGGPVIGETVNFSLDSTVGGISLAAGSASTNSLGEVTATVNSGTVATSVRVTAVVASNTNLATTSSAIVIATGPPDQDSFSLSLSELNPRGWNHEGTEVTVTARLADRYNNKIQDGTAVSFQTELGSIESSCTTMNGACSVIWTSQNPRGTGANAGRSTILATVEGEESFVDSNGDGVFSDGDVSFGDLPEAYRDDNESGSYDPDIENIVDFNRDFIWNDISGTYNGPGCVRTIAPLCAPTPSISVRGSVVLVMAEDTPAVVAIGADGFNTDGVSAAACAADLDCICVDGCNGAGGAGTYFPTSVDLTTTGSLTYTIAGYQNQQVLPVGSSITFAADNGTITGGADQTVRNTSSNPLNGTGATHYTVYLSPDDTPSQDGVLTLEVDVAGFVRGFPPILIKD